MSNAFKMCPESDVQNALDGTLAWTHSTEEGFVTVKVLSHEIYTGKAQVVIHPEGNSSVAAAQAAADVVRQDWGQGANVGEGEYTSRTTAKQCQLQTQAEKQPANEKPVGKTSKLHLKKKNNAWLLEPPEAATEAFADPLSSNCTSGFGRLPFVTEGETDEDTEGSSDAPEELSGCERSLLSAKELQQKALEAAEAAAKETIANFAPKPPFEVPLTHLWPYNAPPL
ncbi:hypothetical protein, conserved, partial [Eimeria necatrix]